MLLTVPASCEVTVAVYWGGEDCTPVIGAVLSRLLTPLLTHLPSAEVLYLCSLNNAPCVAVFFKTTKQQVKLSLFPWEFPLQWAGCMQGGATVSLRGTWRRAGAESRVLRGAES